MKEKRWWVTIMVGNQKLEFSTDPMDRFMASGAISSIMSTLYDLGVEAVVTIEDNKGRSKQ